MVRKLSKGSARGLLLATVSIAGLATVPTAFANIASPPKLSAKQAEQIAVSTFSIPTTYTLQSENYNSSNSLTQPSAYSLNYQSTDSAMRSQSIYVTIDANTGTVLNYSRPSSDSQFVFPAPVSAKQAQQIANGWAQKLYPSQFSNVKPLPLTPNAGSLVGPTQYTYTYERVVNGIAAPFNGFSVTIDQNGKLVGVSDSWTNLNFPSQTKAISQSAANSLYQKALTLHLEYQTVYQSAGKSSTQLVYQGTPQFYPNWWGQQFNSTSVIEFPVINAATGSIVDATGSTYQPAKYAQPKPLVPGGPTGLQNPKPVNWTEQQALSYAQNLFNITGSDTLTSVNQYTNPSADTTWNFGWQRANHMSLQVSIDAKYGFLTSFNQYPMQPQKPASNKAPKLTQAQIDATVTAFVKKAFANDTGDLGLTQSPTNVNNSNGLNTSYQIVRLVGGIPDQSQSGNVYVDPQTGLIQSLWMNNTAQSTASLPSISKAMSETQAISKWMQARPLQLEYLETQPQLASKLATNGKVPNPPAQQQPEVLLTYAPIANQNSSGAFNAVTGMFETSTTTPYTGTIHDISGVAGAAQIQLLVDRELMTVDSQGNVHPGQTMTHAAFMKLLVDALGLQGRYNPQILSSAAAKSALAGVPKNAPDYQEIGSAYSMGWIPMNEPFQPNALTTRDYAAQVLARALGFTPLLAHPEAFQFSPSDVASITSSDLAGDALAATLGMLPLQNGAFHPNNDITLADTAIAVVQAAVIEGEQGHPYPPGPRPLG